MFSTQYGRRNRFYHMEYTCEMWKLNHLPFKRYSLSKGFFADKQTGQKLEVPNLSMQKYNNFDGYLLFLYEFTFSHWTTCQNFK